VPVVSKGLPYGGHCGRTRERRVMCGPRRDEQEGKTLTEAMGG